jgi:hypothetical protein
MPYRMKIHGTGAESFDPPHYLERADLEFAGGIGAGWTTLDPRKAQRFESAAEVLSLWRSTSKSKPTRADGLPNRPLTSFTIEPEYYEESTP